MSHAFWPFTCPFDRFRRIRRSGARSVHVEIDGGDNRGGEPLHLVNSRLNVGRGDDKSRGDTVHRQNGDNRGQSLYGQNNNRDNRIQSLHGQSNNRNDRDSRRAENDGGAGCAATSRFPSAAATRFAGHRRR